MPWTPRIRPNAIERIYRKCNPPTTIYEFEDGTLYRYDEVTGYDVAVVDGFPHGVVFNQPGNRRPPRGSRPYTKLDELPNGYCLIYSHGQSPDPQPVVPCSLMPAHMEFTDFPNAVGSVDPDPVFTGSIDYDGSRAQQIQAVGTDSTGGSVWSAAVTTVNAALNRGETRIVGTMTVASNGAPFGWGAELKVVIGFDEFVEVNGGDETTPTWDVDFIVRGTCNQVEGGQISANFNIGNGLATPVAFSFNWQLTALTP